MGQAVVLVVIGVAMVAMVGIFSALPKHKQQALMNKANNIR